MIAAAIALWLGILLLVPPADQGIEAVFPRLAFIEDVRIAYLSSLGSMTDAKALVAGLAIGERDLLSEAAKEQMREISLTHLVAVSGANLAIVMGAVWYLLAMLGAPRIVRFIFAGVSMLGYILLVGPESSVLRAGAMAFAILVAMATGRGSNPVHALALAVVGLLIIDPNLAVDLGFALSVLATLGLLLAASKIADRLRFLPRPLALGIGAGVAAQAFTLPVLVLIQPGLPIFAVLANLLVEPVVAPVTVLGIVGVLLTPVNVWLSHIATLLASYGTSWILLVAEILAQQPTTRWHLTSGVEGRFLIWFALVALIIAIAASGVARRIATASLVGAIVMLVTLSIADLLKFSVANLDWEVLACDVGQGDALLLRSDRQTVLIDVGREPKLLANCLASSGVSKLDLLVLTHFDADHVGGIAGLDGIQVASALVSNFEDDRPLVAEVSSFLRGKQTKVQSGLRGAVAQLGECSLRILGPRNPATAESSNDASLTSFFDCPKFQVLNLADSGIKAQGEIQSQIAQLADPRKFRVVKVAHHGSKDQLETSYESFSADVALYLVGKNDYGHPTRSALNITSKFGATNLRTDIEGAIGLRFEEGMQIFGAGKLST